MVKLIGWITGWRSFPLVARVMLGAHVLAVAVVYAVFVAMALPGAETNIGAGALLLLVLGLGLPWSLLVRLPFTGDPVDYVVVALPALVNLGLHLLLWRWAVAWRSARPDADRHDHQSDARLGGADGAE